MRKFPDSPVIEIQVSHPLVDTVLVYAYAALEGWKLGGINGDNKLAPPDQFEDDFDAVVRCLAEYVDDASVWTNTQTGQQITPWQAMIVLTGFSEQS